MSGEPPPDVGHIEFVAENGHPVKAVLRGDGTWSCDVTELEGYLNQFYNPADEPSAADGPFGTRQICLAAADFKGKFHLHDVHAPDPDAVY
jgi:hypothetical protein